MYPAYTFADVLAEYAITFYALLAEGYRIRARNYETLAIIAEMPGADPKIRQEFHRNLEYAGMHPSDILKPSDQGSNPAEIKKLLGGK